MDFEDQVTPSANSVMADNLYRLGLFFTTTNTWKEVKNDP